MDAAEAVDGEDRHLAVKKKTFWNGRTKAHTDRAMMNFAGRRHRAGSVTNTAVAAVGTAQVRHRPRRASGVRNYPPSLIQEPGGGWV